MLLSFKRKVRLEADAASAPPHAAANLDAAVRSFSQQASVIGRESAEVRGLLDDTTKASGRGVQAVASLAAQVKDVTTAQDGIRSISDQGLAAVERVRTAVEGVGREVGDVVSTLRDVARAAEGITRIALQTRLVAFNASVEAKRAGDAGRSFSVVAEAVKDLAGQVESSSKEIMRTVALLDGRIDALARQIVHASRRDADAWGATWASDATWSLMGHEVAGRDAIVALWLGAMAQFDAVSFVTAVGPIAITGDTASVRCQTHEVLRTIDGTVRSVAGIYDDSFVRQGGEWLFARRVFAIVIEH